MDINQFLPDYQNIHTEFLEEDLFVKKEFNELKSDTEIDNFDNNLNKLQKHQLIVSRFLSPFSPYKSLLCFHYMGTGKTVLSMGFASFYKNNPVVIIVPRFCIINIESSAIRYRCRNTK